MSVSWGIVKKVLCIRLDSMGDVLMTSPAMRAIKDTLPGVHLTLLTSDAGSLIASLIPEVDEVITYNPPWMKATNLRIDSSLESEMISKLTQGNFDAAIIFTVFSQNPLPAAFMAYMANIPLRLAHCRENPYQLLTEWVPETDLLVDKNMRHEVRRQLDLVAAVGFKAQDENLSIRLPEGKLEEVSQLLTRAGLVEDQPWVVLHPGASAPSRRYPVEGYTEVVRDLVNEHHFQIVLTGSGTEGEMVEEIRKTVDAGTISLVDQLDLGGLAAVLSLSPLLISNNTGPVHIAAAMGTPVVDLYALTNPQHTPWNVPNRVLSHDVPCKYCFKSICPMGHHNCLRLVEPQDVVKAALELLEQPNTTVYLPSEGIKA